MQGELKGEKETPRLCTVITCLRKPDGTFTKSKVESLLFELHHLSEQLIEIEEKGWWFLRDFQKAIDAM